jgi:hypothetical protein
MARLVSTEELNRMIFRRWRHFIAADGQNLF